VWALAERLQTVPPGQWRTFIADFAANTGTNLELFATNDIAGRDTLAKLARGESTFLQTSTGDSWALHRLDDRFVLAIRSPEPTTQRSPLEWLLTLLFYALIALVLMIWIWPLQRDLRALEQAAARYGDRNWSFDAHIGARSQVHSLAETFRKMAARIDGLIESHKDLSNAVSHEIRTPLARMQFEIELAQQPGSAAAIGQSLSNIKADIAAIDGLVRATLEYAILERADVALNLGVHNFTTLIPAIADSVGRDSPATTAISSNVQSDATQVVCDVHLFETVLRNLLYNAARHARRQVTVTFTCQGAVNQLLVDDDGPGIPEQDRLRVFGTFVRLEQPGSRKKGYGLGLAIVKRAIQWHRGDVSVAASPLGGARFCASWPVLSQ
jgi:signal transduction histidine kinase